MHGSEKEPMKPHFSAVDRAAATSTKPRLFSKLGAVAVAVGLIGASTLVAAPAAFADDSFNVTSPANGSVNVDTTFPNVVPFTGIGLSEGNHVDIQYVTGEGDFHTAIYGGNFREENGNWSTNANFDLVGQGQTVVVAQVQELDEDNVILRSIPFTFTFRFAPKPADPFILESPEQLETVDTINPTFTGTGTIGSTVVVTYSARSLQQAEAGRGLVGLDGRFSIEDTDFSRLEPGSKGGEGVTVTEYLPNGERQPGVDPISRIIYFEEAPVPLVPVALSATPTSSTVADATSKGVSIAAVGFSPNEEVIVSVTGPDGEIVELADRPLNTYSDVEDGSFADQIVLPAGSAVGTYTVTITSVRSQNEAGDGPRVASGTFAVVANPAVPAGGNTGSTGNGGSLANTGFEGGAAGGIGALILLVGAAAIVVARRKATV
jgi:hypothetical protein